jgi:hypothetical protein
MNQFSKKIGQKTLPTERKIHMNHMCFLTMKKWSKWLQLIINHKQFGKVELSHILEKCDVKFG